jgi:hypothetical protein
MRVQPVPWPEPDPQVAAAIAAVYGSRKTERPLAVEVRDRLGEWLTDEEMACALNLLRLHAYWTGTPLDRRRTSHLARLELGLAA